MILKLRLIKASHPNVRIKACDLAPTMTSIVESKAVEHGWSNISTEVLDVKDLKTLRDDTFSHVITNFGIAPSLEDSDGPLRAAKDIYRVLKPGGVAVTTIWYGMYVHLLELGKDFGELMG
jgi:ubiquinone/menaquinone biosynthesis C-methylase UbiE